MPEFTSHIDLPKAAPAAPGAGMLRLFAYSLANRMMLKMKGPSGLDVTLQPHLVRNKVRRWNPPSGSLTAPGVDGTVAPTVLGSATVRTPATTNRFTRMGRLGHVSLTSAAAMAGHYNSSVMTYVTIGNGAGEGGFHFVVRLGVSDAAAVAGARQFWGLTSNTAIPTNVEPSTLTNVIGIGSGAANTNLRLYYGGSTAQTSIDLGANFPANTLSVDMYELALFADAGSQDVGWRLENLRTSLIAEGVIPNTTPGTTLPLNSAYLGWRAWRCNNATLLSTALDIVTWAFETDY